MMTLEQYYAALDAAKRTENAEAVGEAAAFLIGNLGEAALQVALNGYDETRYEREYNYGE